MPKTIILGAGFTGLACGVKYGFPIYEATDKAGGICRDYEKDGFKFSNGGPHWIFGKDKGLEYIKTLVEVKEYERKAGVYYNHIFPYPIQSSIYENYVCSNKSMKWDNEERFGSDLSNIFFHPFNEKYTAGLYGEVISQDEYKTPNKNAKGWVNTFCDPVKGLSDLVDKMASQCDIKYRNLVGKVDIPNKRVKIFNDDGFFWENYDRIISTIPLNDFLLSCGYLDDIRILPHTSVYVINIGAERGHSTPEEHWLYIPFCKTGFHRVAFYTNVDPSKSPHGKVGLSVEFSFKEDPISRFSASKVDETIKELQDWGWIGDVITYSLDRVPCAYTWQYNKEDVPNALAWLKERDIISTGRYGKWSFQGLTQSIEDGFNVEV